MGTQPAAVAAAREYRASSAASILEEFVELLSLPNVSRNLADVSQVADHIVAMLQRREIDARTASRPGAAPVVHHALVFLESPDVYDAARRAYQDGE